MSPDTPGYWPSTSGGMRRWKLGPYGNFSHDQNAERVKNLQYPCFPWVPISSFKSYCIFKSILTSLSARRIRKKSAHHQDKYSVGAGVKGSTNHSECLLAVRWSQVRDTDGISGFLDNWLILSFLRKCSKEGNKHCSLMMGSSQAPADDPVTNSTVRESLTSTQHWR